MADQEPTNDSLKQRAQAAGLELTDDEVELVRNGVVRNNEMAQRLRKLLSPELEPTPIVAQHQLPQTKPPTGSF